MEDKNIKFPCSEEAEVAILSASMQQGSTTVEEIIGRVTDEHFWSRSNRIIWKAIESLFHENCPIDAMTVCSKLKDRNQIKEVGGDYSVFQISQAAPTAAHTEHWISILNGKKMLRKAIDISTWCNRYAYETEDPLDLISELETKVCGIREFNEDGCATISSIDSTIQRLENKLNGSVIHGLQTGITALDSTIGGMFPGQITYLCARPGNGKTSLVEQIIENLIEKEYPVLVFQKDMSVETFIERMACRMSKVPYWRYIRCKTTRDQNQAVKLSLLKLRESPLYIYSPNHLTAQDIRIITRREKKKNGIEAVFLDHIQVLDVGRDLREGLTKASIELRRSAMESNLPHFIIAQLNRDADKGGRPQASNIKEFDQAFADADSMVLLWSEQDSKDIGPGECLTVKFSIAKNRNGAVTEEEMWFEGALMRFKEIPVPEDADQPDLL